MIGEGQDESFEREIFALRAEALPPPPMDVGAVIARARRLDAERAHRARLVAWIGAAACAAASMVLAVSDVHRVDSARADTTFVTNDDGSTLMCDRELASRVPREDLESHDDTNVCINP